jgi:hypothetical protein
MSTFRIADDGAATHFDSGPEEILDMCLKRNFETMAAGDANTPPSVGFGTDRTVS